MSKSAAKKRRRKEKKRLEAERARQTSLLDLSSPNLDSGAFASTTDNNAVASPVPGHECLETNGTAGVAASPGSNGSLGPLVPMEAGPKEASWKRIDFVLPRALNSQPFVFNQKNQSEIDPQSSIAKSTINKGDDTQSRKNESLDDILSSKKKKSKMTTSSHQQQKPNADAKAERKTTTSTKTEQQMVSSGRIRKLSDTFEAIYKEEQEKSKSPDLSSFVEVPKKRIKLEHDNKNKSNQQQNRPNKKSDDNEKKKQQDAIREGSSSVNQSQGAEHSRQDHYPTANEVYRGQISGRSVEEAVRDKSGLRPRANSTDGELNLPQRGLCDERMVLGAHRWNTESKVVTSQKTPRGFNNLGNTCFMNATLQCLAFLPPFCQTLISLWENKMSSNKANGPRGGGKLYPGQKVTSHMCSLFQRAHGLKGGAKNHGHGSASISPTQIADALPMIGSCGSRNGYKFRLGRQEDSHEFLVHLLDAMNDGELRAAGINQHASGWRDRLPVQRLDETTFVHRIFGGYFRSQVRCRKCGYRSNTYDPFLDLSLEVSKKSCTSVLNALSEFTRKETLDEENQWKCSGCKKHVCAIKQLTVFRPPLSLCIQLKRFTFDGGFGGGFYGMGFGFQQQRGGSKITKPIQFPASLDLPLSDGRSCAYILTGVVIHVGGSASSGHYTACVRKADLSGGSRWYYIDDDEVEPISEKNVLRQKNAYLLFYSRKEVKLEFPSPPARSMSADEAKEFGRARAARKNSLSEEDLKERQAQYKSDNKHIPQTTLPTVDESQELRIPEKKEKQSLAHLNDHRETKGISPHSIHKEKKSLESELTRDQRETKGTKLLEESGQPTKGNPGYDSSNGKRSRHEESSDDSSSVASSSSNSSSSTEASGEPENQNQHASVDLSTSMKPRGDPPGHEHEASDSEASSSSSSTSSSSNSGAEDSKESNDKSKDLSNKTKPSQESTSSSSGTSVPREAGERPTPTEDNRTRVVLKTAGSRGKVMFMMGKKKKSWTSKASPVSSTSRGHDYDLLGNVGVQKWDDEEAGSGDGDLREKTEPSPKAGGQSNHKDQHKGRKQIVEKIEKEDRSRKRGMHLDRWDMSLDQGRLKKVKSSKPDKSESPKTNPFQRIQASMRKMKGSSRQQSKRRRHQGFNKRPHVNGGRYTY